MSITSKATLTVPCVGPRVRGSAAYLFPRTAEWAVHAADYGSGWALRFAKHESEDRELDALLDGAVIFVKADRGEQS